MHWQDIVFTIGAWIFAILLIPSIRSQDKPALTSSFFTATLLSIYVFVYASLYFWGAMISTAVLALAWWILAYQKWRMNKNS